LGDKLLETEAIGIFGSLARGDFHDRSDTDISVVVKAFHIVGIVGILNGMY